MDRLKEYFAQHEEQAYIAKILVIAMAIYPILEFVEGNTFILFILLPTLVILYLVSMIAATQKSTIEILSRFISLAPMTGYERAAVKANYPVVTTALVTINCIVFFVCSLVNNEDAKLIRYFFYFPPPSNELWSYPVALVAHLFLHSDIYHLGGNMIMLWAIGTVLERRLGLGIFLLYYIALGILASFATLILFGSDIPSLGASGAIFGLYGIFSVRCYFKKISFQIPILGPMLVFAPWLGFLSFNIQIDSLLLFGTQLVSQIAGAYDQFQTPGIGGTNYIAHMAGLAGGIILSFIAGYQKEAVEERHLEEGVATFESAQRPRHALNQINKAIELNPGNLEALLTKARLLTRKGPNSKGLEAYERVLSVLVLSDPSEAARVGRECLAIFREFADKSLYLSLGNIMKNEYDFKTALWLYKKVILNEKLNPTWREQAYFNYALILIKTQEHYMAKQYLTKFVSLFPGSKYAEVARERLEML